MHPHPQTFGRKGRGIVLHSDDAVAGTASSVDAVMHAPLSSAVPFRGSIVHVGESAFAATRSPEALRSSLGALDRAVKSGSADLPTVAAAMRQVGAAKEIRALSRSPERLAQVSGLAQAGDASAVLVTQAVSTLRLADMKRSAMSVVAGALLRKDPRALAQIKAVSKTASRPGPAQQNAQTMMSMVGACCSACANHSKEEEEAEDKRQLILARQRRRA